ncbi:MAG: ExbD/TolR family protein [Kistimonas sp.]|nr:ExbD/TolR family protein [Kistimonas sp.]
MVPFIDIMMVLLVAFMVSSPLFTQGVRVELPKASGEPVKLPPDLSPLVVSVKADGGLYLSLESTDEKPLSLKALADKVARIVQARPATPVLVRGDREASYGVVIQAMAALQKVGVEDVGLITEPGELK